MHILLFVLIQQVLMLHFIKNSHEKIYKYKCPNDGNLPYFCLM